MPIRLGKSRNSVFAIQDFDGTDQLSVRSLKHGVSMEPSCSYHEISAEIFKASSLIGLVIGYTVAGKGDLAEASLKKLCPSPWIHCSDCQAIGATGLRFSTSTSYGALACLLFLVMFFYTFCSMNHEHQPRALKVCGHSGGCGGDA